MRLKGKSIGIFRVYCRDTGWNDHSVRMTHHAEAQAKARNVSNEKILEAIQSISDLMPELQQKGEDICAVNNGLAVVFAFKGNRIIVITVLLSEKIFVKRNTLKIKERVSSNVP